MHTGLLRLLRMQSFFCTNRNHSLIVVHYQFDYFLSTCHTFRNLLLTKLKATVSGHVCLMLLSIGGRCRRCLAITRCPNEVV